MTVAVIGGGIIGLSVAWRLVRDGVDVTVLDDDVPGAWQVAAGMLAPGGESAHQLPALGRLMSRSAEMWPRFAASLGGDVGYVDQGTLSLAVTADDLAELAPEWARRQLPVLPPSRLREWEPALSPRVRAGVHVYGDCQVDPRRVVAALRERLADRIQMKRVDSVADLHADTVVVAAGCGTARLTGLPIRPVKGQVLRLHSEPGLLRHVLNVAVDGRRVYLVPRHNGEIVVGATEEERTDPTVTAGAVHDLLHAAIAVVPGLAEAALIEARVGHRPGTPDNAPLLGRLDDRVIVAAGHHRNGVLLAPVTAELVAGLILGRPTDSPLAGTLDSPLAGSVDSLLVDFAPGRFR